MVARLDHITVVAPSLDSGAAHVEAALGVLPGPGRKHPGMGTHNLLLRLGTDTYLEVISIDPEVAAVARPRWFGMDQTRTRIGPRLAAWVASTDDIEGAATPELGDVETMRRAHHTWKMAIKPDGSLPLDGAAPLLIQRASNAHPAAALPPSGLLLRTLRIRHPEPGRVIALLATIGLASEPEIIVTGGDECGLVAEIETPTGRRTLS